MSITIAYRDIEDIIDDVIARLNDATYGLNAAITAINTQKSAIDTAHSRVVMTVPKFVNNSGTETLTENQNLFFFVAEEIVNCDPFMVVALPTWTTDEMGAETATVEFLIYMEDPSDGTDPRRKLLRYVRALKEVMRDMPFDDSIVTETKTGIIEPGFTPVTESRSYYSAGVKLELVYA